MSKLDKALRQLARSMIVVADESSDSQWWVVYLLGVPVFGCPSEVEADKCAEVLRQKILMHGALALLEEVSSVRE